MDEAECPPVTVEGDWSPAQAKTVKKKLQLYFQSKKKSGGGDCRVEAEDGAPRAAVYFRAEAVRNSVLSRQNHEIILESQTIKLRLISAPDPTSLDVDADSSTDSKTPKSEAEAGKEASAKDEDESDSVQLAAVVLENVADDMSMDLLSMLVENISGLDEGGYSLEIMWETNSAVVAFNNPADVEKFLTVSRTNQKLQKHGLKARPLEAANSVRVENLPSNVVKDMLEMYFEKSWDLPTNVVMIPEEQAAIVTFSDPKVVKSICVKQDYVMRSIPVKVHPYYESLGTALYGKERPTWKMPQPFTEKIHHVVWKFLLMKKLLKHINHQMQPHFCSVDLDKPEVKLSPLPSFLRQKGLTSKQVEMWMGNVQEAFRQQMSQYTAFECPANAAAWKAAEKDVRAVVKEDAILVIDASRDILTVAGRADSIKRVKAPVENIVLKAMTQIKRQTESVSEEMILSPAMFYILKQDGLQKAAQDISPDMNLSYNEGTQKLTITGLPAEVFQTKAWILERNVGMSKKRIDVPPGLLGFLKTVDPMDMSQDLFTSQGISAIYSIESKGVLLLGSSDRVLADAESKMQNVLSLQTLDVEDQQVLKLQNWVGLNQQLLDTYNSLKKKTVTIYIHPERRDKVTVAGFQNPVKEVSRNLKEFIVNYSRVQETLRVVSCAVVQFIDKKKTQDWSKIAKTYEVTVNFDDEKPKIIIDGARLHVQKAKSSFQELTSALSTDTLILEKPGAKKYFKSQGSLFLSTIMSEFNCVVVLQSENQEEEDEEDYEEGNVLCYCKVQTTSGVQVSVSRADICSFRVDAVVNAANEELQHIGGLALALLKAAGPELQKICNDYTSRNGHLRPGDAIVTDACNLPCKYIVHAVGPRFSDYDRKTSVSRLKCAVKESLSKAEKANCSSVALPAISSGVFGFPVDLCAETIAQAVREYCDSPGSRTQLTEIHLVDNNNDTVRVLANAVNKEFMDLGPTMTVPQHAGGKGAGGYQRGRGRGQNKPPRAGQRGGRGGRGGAEGAGAGPQGGQRGNRGGSSPRRDNRPGEHGGQGMVEQTTAEGLKIVLCKGNIQDQTTDVIVNTISEDMILDQGAVSKALLQAAGSGLQSAVQSEAGTTTLLHGDVVITSGFKLRCQKVFHAVCPCWDKGAGQAEEELTSIIRFCLEESEKLRMSSLSFPAIGTGNLSFPRDVVSRVLLKEIHSYSRRKTPRHLRTVAIVVHPSDSQTVECFTREFKGQPARRNTQQEARVFNESPAGQSQQSSASFSKVSSPSLGVYRMQMGQLTLAVSSGDITKEACDVIINSSNQGFTLKSGVSKAILDSAGLTVELECSQIVRSPGYQPSLMILTSAGSLPSKNIIHIVGQNDPAKVREVVYSVLKFCEENRFSSVSFPALGTGQGGAHPSAVADAMVDAVVEFVRKKHARFVRSVKILIFQTNMMAEFHRSMMRREGEQVEEKSLLTKVKDTLTSIFTGFMEERPSADALVLEREEFEPTVFQLCADNEKAVSQAKKRIKELIVAEQAQRTIADQVISQMSQADMDQLRSLQRELTVSIRLDRGTEDQEPKIHLEGLTRDVFTAESVVRDIIRNVEKSEYLKSRALMASALVEWQFQHHNGTMVPFDIYTNLKLEEALQRKENVKIKICSDTYTADVKLKKAVSANGRKEVELRRKERKADAPLPSHWDDMKGKTLKLFPVAAGTSEYSEVDSEVKKTGLSANIISIERVQNVTLWQSYQLMKREMEMKNKHKNNEKRLFHGTGANSIDLINKQGFNRSYAGTHEEAPCSESAKILMMTNFMSRISNGDESRVYIYASESKQQSAQRKSRSLRARHMRDTPAAMYGNGSYFAVDPVYSAQGYAKPDANRHRRMYLARVLVGDFTQGKSGIITPPSKRSGNAADLYDSVTDNTHNPTMFIVFSDIQAYPEYLITFT